MQNSFYNIFGLSHYCLNDSSTRTARMPQVCENDPNSIFCLTGIFYQIFIPKRHWLFPVLFLVGKKKDLRHLIHVCLHMIVSVGLKGFRHILDCDSYDFLHLSGMWVSLAISSIVSTTITLTRSDPLPLSLLAPLYLHLSFSLSTNLSPLLFLPPGSL